MILLLLGLLVQDLDPENRDWNGLSEYRLLLEAQGLKVKSPKELRISTLPPHAALILMDPQAPEAPDALLRWLQGGGRLLLTVEGPNPLLELFELRALSVKEEGEPLELLEVRVGGPFAGLKHLLLNRPCLLLGPERLPPILKRGEGGFAYHLRLGAGEVILLADSSLLINLMLEMADNRRLARILGRWLGEGEPPLYLLSPQARLVADPPQRRPLLARLNAALASLRELPPPSPFALKLVLSCLALLLTLGALLIFRDHSAEDLSKLSRRAERQAGRAGGPACDPPRCATASERRESE